MRRTLMLVALFVMLGSGLCLAQDSYKESDNRAAWQKRWAMQFAVKSATLGEFNGATISLRRHYGLASAVRLGITLGPIHRDEYIGDAGGQPQSNERNSATVGLAMEYMRYVGAPSSVNLLWLVGPRVRYRWSHDVTRAITTHDWAAALQFGLGVEWFLHRRVSLSGEYVSEFFYRRRENRIEMNNGTRTDISTVYGFGSGGVRFGVAVSL